MSGWLGVSGFYEKWSKLFKGLSFGLRMAVETAMASSQIEVAESERRKRSISMQSFQININIYVCVLYVQ